MTGTRGRIGTIAVLVGVAVVAMLIAFVTGESDSRRSGPPLDPRSTIDSGARAAVILLEQQGRSVSIGSATSSVDTFLVLDDNLQATERERLLDLQREVELAEEEAATGQELRDPRHLLRDTG